MIEQVIRTWEEFVAGERPDALESLLADDVVFLSPVVFTPQVGKAITIANIAAAAQALPGDPEAGEFRYTKKLFAGDTAMLEFETSVDGKYVNGVHIIGCNGKDQIVEIRVMIRPLQAVNAVHAQMRAALESLQQS